MQLSKVQNRSILMVIINHFLCDTYASEGTLIPTLIFLMSLVPKIMCVYTE